MRPVHIGRAWALALFITACAPATTPTDASRDTGFAFDAGDGCGPAYLAFRYATNTGLVRDVCVALPDGVQQDFLSASGCRAASISARGTLASGSRVTLEGYGDPFSSIGNRTLGVTVETLAAPDPELCGTTSSACRLYSARCSFEVTRAGGRGELVEAHLSTGCQLSDGMTSASTTHPSLRLTDFTIRAPLVRGSDLSPMDGGTTACP